MPVINGKPQKATFTSLKLGELSSVDSPAQQGAVAVIMKRDDEASRKDAVALIQKYVGVEDGAHDFQEVLVENKFSQEIWPFTDALSQSIRSIVGDKTLSADDRETKINESVQQFLTAVRGISPGAAGEAAMKGLIALFEKRGTKMPKTVEQLEAALAKANEELDTVKGQLTDMTQKADKAKQDMEEATEQCKAARSALEKSGDNAELAKQVADLKAENQTLKADLAKATDEVIKVEGEEVRKSDFGEAGFRVIKAQEDRVATAIRKAKAQENYPNVAGGSDSVALILKVRDQADEETQKAIDAVLKSNEAMAKSAFARLGTSFEKEADVHKARETFDSKVADIAKRDNLSDHQALSKARREFPTEYREAYPNSGAN